MDDARWRAFERRRDALATVRQTMRAMHIGDKSVADLARRPEMTTDDLGALLAGIGDAASVPGVLATVLAEAQYDGFIRRASAEARRQAEMERRRIPEGFVFDDVIGMRSEARTVLARFQPATFGQAGRLEGVNPADLTILIVAVDRWKQRRAAHPV